MRKNKNIFLIVFFFSLSALLSGCKLVLLDPKGIIAADEKNILITAVLLMLTVVVPVIILILLFSWRYRAKNVKATYSPQWEHSTLLEIICWSVPCLIILVLGVITWTSSHRLDPFKPLDANHKPLTIQAIALEWRWLFIYPEQNIATIDFVQFPVGVPIQFFITAEGPMNSFQIPQLAGQIYAMAGMQSQLHLMANEAGDYAGISANFSGEGFSDMKFMARASSEKQFNEWVAMVKQSPKQLTAETYHQLILPSTDNHVTYFSSADKEIFHSAIMKSMMPMPTNKR